MINYITMFSSTVYNGVVLCCGIGYGLSLVCDCASSLFSFLIGVLALSLLWPCAPLC